MTDPLPPSRWAPSIPAIVFVLFWIAASVIFPDRMLNADGDMLRHVRHGTWMLEHGRMITADPFSFTRGGQPFVGFEYGSQLVYALVHSVAGLAGIAVFAGLLIATSYALLARFLLARGVDALLTYLVAVAAAVLGAVHWSPRPHLFTLLGVMVLLHFLEPGARRRPWLLAPVFAVWANLHGGFVYGLTLLGIYLAGSGLEWLRARREPDRRSEWARQLRYYAVALGVAAAATLLTPHGLALHGHIVDFFGQPFLMENTQEFFSPDFHTAGGKLLLAAILGIVLAFMVSPGLPTGPRVLLLLANLAFALQARRNIPLFAATVFPVLAMHFDIAWRGLPDRRGIRAVFDRDAKRGRTLPIAAIMLAGFALIAALGGRVGRLQLIPNALDPAEFPITAVERGRETGYGGRIFHDFVWGGYLLYAWPEQRVFIDGGTDFYGPALMAEHMNIVAMQPGWRESLSRWEISRVLMPTGSAMLYELARGGGWRVGYCDPTATVLDRDTTVPPDAAWAASLDACAASEAREAVSAARVP